MSQDLGKEHKSSLEPSKSPTSINVPPITPDPSTLSPTTLLSSAIRLPGQHSFLVQNKMKKHVNSVRKLPQPLAPNLFNICLSTK
eukprot:g25411.t1